MPSKEIDPVGAFPREMARHENAIHYQGFALASLVLIAEFASRQDFDLYAYNSHHRTLRDAILFYGRAVADPTLVTPYPPTPKILVPTPTTSPPSTFTPRVSPQTSSHLPSPTPSNTPTTETRIGGNITILSAKQAS